MQFRILKMITTSGFLTAVNCSKFVFVQAPTGGAYSAPPDHLAGLRGPTSKREEERRREGQMSRPTFLNVPTPLTVSSHHNSTKCSNIMSDGKSCLIVCPLPNRKHIRVSWTGNSKTVLSAFIPVERWSFRVRCSSCNSRADCAVCGWSWPYNRTDEHGRRGRRTNDRSRNYSTTIPSTCDNIHRLTYISQISK